MDGVILEVKKTGIVGKFLEHPRKSNAMSHLRVPATKGSILGVTPGPRESEQPLEQAQGLGHVFH